jgi:glutathione S-transferase
MRLLASPASPFARKARVAAIELGLAGRVAVETVRVLPTERCDDYQRDANPLGKVPSLVLDDGRVLYDSLVICEYFDAIAGGNRLLPASGNTRFDTLTRHALASGMTDAIVLVRYEDVLRPEAMRSAQWRDGQLRKVQAGLDWFEAHPASLHGSLDLAQIALACFLGYADFRYPDLGWREARPQLAAWYDLGILPRPSFRETMPAA